jgi:hypothetical protein
VNFDHPEGPFGDIVVPGHAGVVEAGEELVSVSSQPCGEVPGLSLGLAPTGPGPPAGRRAERQQGEGFVKAGMVSGPDNCGTTGVDGTTAGTGGGLALVRTGRRPSRLWLGRW